MKRKTALENYLRRVAGDLGLMILGSVRHSQILGLLGGPKRAAMFLWWRASSCRFPSRGNTWFTVIDLDRKLIRYIRHYNKAPKPVKWIHRDPSKRITTDSRVTVHH